MKSKQPSSGKNQGDDAANQSLSGLKRGYHRYHSRQRQRNHLAAEAEAENGAVQAIIDHPLVPADSPEMIDSQAGLSSLIEHVRKVGSFAYDTEFIGELSYYPQLCLLQLATVDRVALVDPLAELDLSELWAVIADADVEKIVHAGQQDLEPVQRLVGKLPANIFDTQIASGLAGMPYPLSLRETVRSLLKVTLAKGATFTQWDRRPLSPTQLRYAADDVRYLPAVRAGIGKKLDDMGHADWATQACDQLCDPAAYAFDLDIQTHRVRGRRGIKGRALAVLQAMVKLRDQAAREQDIPPRTLLNDPVPVALAKRPPKTKADVQSAPSMPRPVANAYGEQILQAVADALALPDDQLPTSSHAQESAQERLRVDSLWAAAQCTCLGQGVDPALATTRQGIRVFCRVALANGPLGELSIMQGWRGELLGEPLCRLMQGQEQIALNWADGRLGASTSKG